LNWSKVSNILGVR